VTCSLRQSGIASRVYTVDDIRAFLKETKHGRNVRIDDFFPDVEQFYTKMKSFMIDGCFTEQEVYQLKKVITKLNALMNTSVDTDEA